MSAWEISVDSLFYDCQLTTLGQVSIVESVSLQHLGRDVFGIWFCIFLSKKWLKLVFCLLPTTTVLTKSVINLLFFWYIFYFFTGRRQLLWEAPRNFGHCQKIMYCIMCKARKRNPSFPVGMKIFIITFQQTFWPNMKGKVQSSVQFHDAW